jgi:hypothetical protein
VTQQHPITPPPELLQLWFEQHHDYDKGINELLIEAAQYGADQELEACCEWVDWKWSGIKSRELRAARRPKPATLKEQSLKHLEVMERDGHYLPEILQDLRRAVEQLDG